KQRTRIYYSDAQKAVMWERWKQGWTLHQIAQLLNRTHTSVQRMLDKTGGIRPPPRSRASTALTLAEREEISRSMAEGHSIRSIASKLGRAASTVSRELSQRRSSGLPGERSRQRSLDSRPSPQVLQTSQEQSLGADRDRQASGDVVARADRRVARACLSVRREPTRVARDYLSNPLHPGAWRPEEGVAAAPEAHARDAPVA